MDINYYDKHQEEFEAVTLALKANLEEVWGSSLKNQGESLDDQVTYMKLFEELQYNLNPYYFKENTSAKEMDEDKVAAFVARTRDYKHGITIKSWPGRPQKWLKGRIKPLHPVEGTNLCWIDTSFKSQRGADYPFQFAMIAFNHVVPVLNLSVFNVRRAPAFAFEQSKRATIGGRFIRVDESRDLPLLHVVEDFTQKPVCSFAVTTGGEIKIDSAAPAVDGPVQIRPAAIDLHVGFIHVPRAKIGRVTPVPAQPFFHFRRITLNPAVNRGVIDIHSAFSQHLLQLTVTDAVFAVPAYGPQNDVTLKMPAFEWVHVQLHQQKGMISLSPPTICNSAKRRGWVIPRKRWKSA